VSDTKPGTERMAVELTLYVNVPADITEAEMDRRARDIAYDVAVDHGSVAEPKCWLV